MPVKYNHDIHIDKVNDIINNDIDMTMTKV
jgi:hypothetical protein